MTHVRTKKPTETGEQEGTDMAYHFFPSCKATAQFKEASKLAKQYVENRFGIRPVGCCRPNHKKLAADDTAIVVCNNCAAIIEENADAAIRFLWQVIDHGAVGGFVNPHAFVGLQYAESFRCVDG